jgi:hypothetical protein
MPEQYGYAQYGIPGQEYAQYGIPGQESAMPNVTRVTTYECVANPLVVIIQDDQVLIVGRDGSVKRVARMKL